MLKRKKPLQRKSALKRSPLKRKAPLKKMSAKRRIESAIYAQKRTSFLTAHPFCQVWLKENSKQQSDVTPSGWINLAPMPGMADRWVQVPKATDVHHTAKRGKFYLDEMTWLATCRASHERIHRNPSWARARGYLK